MTEITRLSYSAIRSYLDCARAFEYRYLEKLPAVLNGRLIGGRVYHLGIAYALKRKMAGHFATAEEVSDIMSDRWDAELSERAVYDELGEPKIEAKQVDWGDDKPGQLKDIVTSLAGIYLKKVLPQLEPVAVEEKLTGTVGGVSFIGYVDLRLPNYGVVDHKFAKRKLPQQDADRDIQFSAYAALLAHPVWCAFHQAIDSKSPDINIVLTERGESDIEWFSTLVSTVWQSIQTGLYPPNPTSWHCSENYCPYWVECKILQEY